MQGKVNGARTWIDDIKERSNVKDLKTIVSSKDVQKREIIGGI